MTRIIIIFLIAYPFTITCQTVSINAGNFEAIKFDAIGNAGRINLPGNLRSILIGQDVGNASSIGINNIFIGKENGFRNTSGAYNITLGHFAGAFNSIGSDNTFLGYVAGYQNSTGSDNTFVGRGAGISNQTGSFNTLIGSGTSTGSTGNSNIMLGHQTGAFANVDHSIAIGDSALYNSIGYENIVIGSKAAFSLSSGRENVILGTRAAMNTNISQSVLIGHEAGRYTSGSKKIAIGYQAGMYASNGSIAIGEQANLNNGGNTIAIGNFAGAMGSSFNSIFIGNYAGYDENTDHRLKIGNLAYGTIIDGELDNRKIKINNNLETGEFHINAHTNINHATLFMKSQTGPESRVMILEAGTENLYLGDVDGTGGSTLLYADGNERMRVLGNGNIGIGTSSPGDRLQIDADTGQDALRVRIGGTTRLRVHDNGGVSIGANRTPPAAGLIVENLNNGEDAALRANSNGQIYKESSTKYLSYSPQDFNPLPGTITSTLFISIGGSAATTAPIHLPDGAKITSLKFWIIDNQSVGNLLINLNQKPFNSQYTFNTIASLDSSSSSVNMKAYTVNLNHTIDNVNNAYWLDVSSSAPPGLTISLCHGRITYEY